MVPVKVVSGQDGSLIHEFKAELADDASERTMGLMFRKELGKDRGMLFIFDAPVETPFWMRNTLISLDIIFIDTQMKIVNIVERAEPQTTTPRPPEGPYQYVLEIIGGRSAELGIHAGDLVEFKL